MTLPITDVELEHAWMLYRILRKAGSHWFDDALWTVCIGISREGVRVDPMGRIKTPWRSSQTG